MEVVSAFSSRMAGTEYGDGVANGMEMYVTRGEYESPWFGICNKVDPVTMQNVESRQKSRGYGCLVY